MTPRSDPPEDPPGGGGASDPPDSAPGDRDEDDRNPGPPTPVRAAMGEPAGAREADSPPGPRELEVDGETWRVTVGGRQKTGTSPDTGASLLLLHFARPDDEAEEPEREVYAVARELNELDEEALVELFRRSRPYRSPERPDTDERRSGPRTTGPKGRGRGRRR